MLLTNMMSYGWRMKISRAELSATLSTPMQRDDVVTLAALPGMAVFAVTAWLIELFGLRLLLLQEKVGALVVVCAWWWMQA